MKLHPMAAWQTGRREPRAPALFRSLLPVIGALLLWHGVPSAPGADSFAPLSKQSTFFFTNAIILVSPTTLDFGLVPTGKSKTNTVLVENIGRGKLVGTASVPAPFKIVSGGNYTLTAREIQVVQVAYTPGRTRTNEATLTFTGGGGAKATVIGRRAGGLD